MEQKDLTLKEIRNYYGTEQYYHMQLFDVNYTDGVNYIMENGYAWFVTDVLAVIKTKFRNEDFISAELVLKENDNAELIMTDGNNEIYKQKYGFTDAKVGFNLFFTNGVLMLSGEY